LEESRIISIFDAPQRAMAEALSRSPQFDFIHIDSNMIPSLASAGYLEPLDEYMKKGRFQDRGRGRLRYLHDL
jgi:maltose-binding protein MalE